MPGESPAVPFGFENITANSVADAAIGEAQLVVDVTDAGGDQVLFTFTNLGPEPSSIADVYFDDGAGTLLGIAAINDSDGGVSFSPLAAPRNLPGGNSIGFNATAGFLADSDPPVQPNGVNPGESLGILFDLQAGQSFADVLADLNSSALRIGIHVQGFDSEGSESFVNRPIPEPHSTALFVLGAAVVGLALHRQPPR